MTDSTTLIEVGKWAAIVFTAGFIGYFGKYLSKIIIQHLHKSGEEAQPEPVVSPESEIEKKRLEVEQKKQKYEYKLKKKRLKDEEKRSKQEAKRQEKAREEDARREEKLRRKQQEIRENQAKRFKKLREEQAEEIGELHDRLEDD
jgi:Skp family chaperone for outer membrane proteins